MNSGKAAEMPRVMVSVPRYSEEVIYDSVISKSRAENNDAYGPEDHVQVVAELGSRGSLLPWTFNSILAEALNQRDAGLVTHLVMQHSDIVAEPGWINALWQRMRRRGDVLVSAVVPLKDHERSKTSTAVGVRDNPFDFRRYVRTSDRPGMPETFATGDVASQDDEVLLVNTGLWMADLRWEGWNSFQFQFMDQIRVNPETGKRQAWVVSEDWFLSHYLDKHKAPYSATWLPLKHIGFDYFHSFELPPVYPTFVAANQSSESS